jgi:antitoxin (DNA-binding transcriptional repressor) of toxin-antitoxin stability system
MEKSYGIEAARARLGEIADHARTTGETIGLTRHGRTVAVIGPATVVKPAGSVEVTLHFPNDDWTVQLPAVPRTGEIVDWADPGYGSTRWVVTEVVHSVGPDDDNTIGLTLDPADTEATNMVKQIEAARRTVRNRTTEK